MKFNEPQATARNVMAIDDQRSGRRSAAFEMQAAKESLAINIYAMVDYWPIRGYDLAGIIKGPLVP